MSFHIFIADTESSITALISKVIFFSPFLFYFLNADLWRMIDDLSSDIQIFSCIFYALQSPTTCSNTRVERKKEKNKSNDSLLYKASLCIFETFFLNCFVQPKIGSRGNNRFAWMSSHNFILHLMTRIMEIIWSGWLYIEVWLAPGHSKYFKLFVCWFVVRGDQCWVTISCSLASTWSSPTTGQDIWEGRGVMDLMHCLVVK